MNKDTMSQLGFATLREANVRRLPQFRNGKGETAHNKEDDSDWSPAQWFQAMIGEMGEFAQVRIAYEQGRMPFTEYEVAAAKEQADVAIYADILARRSLDLVDIDFDLDAAQVLMLAISYIGQYANWRKKLDRGDVSQVEFAQAAKDMLNLAKACIDRLIYGQFESQENAVGVVHETGIDLGEAITCKFNEVSERVGSSIFITANSVLDGGL